MRDALVANAWPYCELRLWNCLTVACEFHFQERAVAISIEGNSFDNINVRSIIMKCELKPSHSRWKINYKIAAVVTRSIELVVS